jgi:predicted acetyltransferase
VTDFVIRPVEGGELRAAADVFVGSLHMPPVADERWKYLEGAYEPGRTLGAFAGEALIGTALAWGSTLTVPGGANVPMAAVTGVGVRADHTRRGILTELMRQQLGDIAAAGEVFAGLHASEPTIYGRFGYGVATRASTVRVHAPRARMRPEVPTAGTVRLITVDEAMALLPEAYSRLRPARAGVIGRPPVWWVIGYENRAAHCYFRAAAHYDQYGVIDGFVGYRTAPFPSDDPRVGAAIAVIDFAAATQQVENDLWRFLVGIDLIEEVTVYLRPMDDPLDAMLVDPYAIRGEDDDDLWVRIVDVPAALAARTYGPADPIVVEVVDTLLPDNSGRYLISPHGTERTEAPATVTMNAETLAMVYVGTWRPSALAAVGRLTAHDPAALPAADRLFGTDRPAWCGSMF